MMKSEKDVEREKFVRQYVLNRALSAPHSLNPGCSNSAGGLPSAGAGAANEAIAAWNALELFLNNERAKR